MKIENGEMIFEELHLFCGSGGGALGFQQAQHEYKGINGSPLVLAGNSEKVWREHIGNMVPPPAACAIANTLLATMMPNYMGEWHWGFSDDVIWVNSKTKNNQEIGVRS